jgi:hypothetical protein
MTLDECVDIVIDVHGYPRWMALIEVELALLNALAARDRLMAMGFTHLNVTVSAGAPS